MLYSTAVKNTAGYPPDDASYHQDKFSMSNLCLTHSSSSAPSPSMAGFALLGTSALFAIILSVHDSPAASSPAKLHFVTVPASNLAKET